MKLRPSPQPLRPWSPGASFASLLLQLCIVAAVSTTPLAQDSQVNVATVVVTKNREGWKRASTDEEMAPMYKENMDPDFVPYQPTHKYSLKSLTGLTQYLMGQPKRAMYVAMVIVRAGKITVMPIYRKMMALSVSRMKAMKNTLKNSTTTLPDTIFLMNTWDTGLCDSLKLCPIPFFSIIKKLDAEGGGSRALDVLLPFFNHVYEDLHEVPWESKTRKALLRAAMQNGMDLNCTRLEILRLAKEDPKGQSMLDIGITNNLKKNFKVEVVPQVPITDHAKWAWLISADGYAASCRFGKLLGTNSLVLKETSGWIEYYYRSCIPNKHYVPFTKDTFMEVLTSVAGDDARAKKVSLDGQKFMYTYLGQESKVLYVREAITRYNKLFGGRMEKLAQALGDLPTNPVPRNVVKKLRAIIDADKSLQ